ncbi:lysophospholipid acyltransferase family protein [Paenibacillus daejeonensis]|uniref:lysophospholipid acyltransferase family protein n=1 Tax=Paenibacillus daejeonensis TaxID=135193 RepID=UPI0003708089|nr:lysophospholipid acyltransferase family protein [Paenibacillus daejeonensis]
MIEAAKSAPFDRLFFHYNKHYLLRRHFHFVGLQGDLDAALPSGGCLFIANHSSWWDGMVLYHAFRTCSRGDHYVMMDEKQMRDFRFFRKLGVFSIDKSHPRRMLVSLRYAQGLLEAGKCVWMFPQGEIQHLEHRPLRFQTGIGYVLERCPQTTVLPVTLYYSSYHHQKTEVSLLAGTPLRHDWGHMGKQAATALIEQKFSEQLERHRSRCIDGDPQLANDFSPLLSSGGSTSEAFLTMKKKVRAWKSFFGS